MGAAPLGASPFDDAVYRGDMRPFLLLFVLAACVFAEAVPVQRAVIGPMKTGIYVGSVRLTTTPFERNGDKFSSVYEAKVRPWFFWSETGHIQIALSDEDLEKLARGETVEFTGEAVNNKKKPRRVTGRAQPADANSGKIKVRIDVDDIELIFNGTYRLE